MTGLPTGRQKEEPMSGKMIDETVSVGPRVYSGAQSPLIVEVKADGDGRIDIDLPH